MRPPATADERERRIVEYLVACHQGRLAEFRLGRMNRIANARKRLMQLINEMIEARSEEIAASMLAEYAPPRPMRKAVDVTEGRLPIAPKKAGLPPWIRKGRTGTEG